MSATVYHHIWLLTLSHLKMMHLSRRLLWHKCKNCSWWAMSPFAPVFSKSIKIYFWRFSINFAAWFRSRLLQTDLLFVAKGYEKKYDERIVHERMHSLPIYDFSLINWYLSSAFIPTNLTWAIHHIQSTIRYVFK